MGWRTRLPPRPPMAPDHGSRHMAEAEKPCTTAKPAADSDSERGPERNGPELETPNQQLPLDVSTIQQWSRNAYVPGLSVDGARSVRRVIRQSMKGIWLVAPKNQPRIKRIVGALLVLKREFEEILESGEETKPPTILAAKSYLTFLDKYSYFLRYRNDVGKPKTPLLAWESRLAYAIRAQWRKEFPEMEITDIAVARFIANATTWATGQQRDPATIVRNLRRRKSARRTKRQ